MSSTSSVLVRVRFPLYPKIFTLFNIGDIRSLVRYRQGQHQRNWTIFPIEGNAQKKFFVQKSIKLSLKTYFQDFLFPGGSYDFGTKAISFIFIGLWYQEMLLQIVISVNRMVSIVFPVRATFFTRNVMIALAIGSFVVAYFMATIGHFILPCCR